MIRERPIGQRKPCDKALPSDKNFQVRPTFPPSPSRKKGLILSFFSFALCPGLVLFTQPFCQGTPQTSLPFSRNRDLLAHLIRKHHSRETAYCLNIYALKGCRTPHESFTFHFAVTYQSFLRVLGFKSEFLLLQIAQEILSHKLACRRLQWRSHYTEDHTH